MAAKVCGEVCQLEKAHPAFYADGAHHKSPKAANGVNKNGRCKREQLKGLPIAKGLGFQHK